ncbi:serine/threonine protein kinase [Actinomycetospora succinea]|uniref:non-specific serine/threonine protein kinase n=1 Tax=Actinomycetospora succinea TaxID=663603 RepID=A0A4R6UJK6_9PSEU|nr:serine/threonine-protein kinase [Actinomycetospora succinea]TDQ46692.1 serine/threonine protein kinase [Actinomycetospora succinea]
MTDTFGPYRLEGRLGRGGMGEVHRAYDTRRDREIALKRLTPELADDPEIRERFERECRTAARLSSPHVVPIHDFGVIEGRLFLDMRLVEGRDLAKVLAEEGPLGPARAVGIVEQVADALDDAHANDLVHRDVKPGNVLVTAGRGPDFVHLVDFGIVRLASTGTRGRNLTGTGTTLGTLAYMAPEQFEGAAVDRRADVYALAVVLYECLVGRPPFDGDMPAMLHQHLAVSPAPPSSRRPGLPPALDAVVLRGLAKRPADRYAEAGELAEAARAAVEGSGPVPAAAPPVAGPEHGRETWIGPPAPYAPPGQVRWDSAPHGASGAWSPGAPPPPGAWNGSGPWAAPATPPPPPTKRGRTVAIVAGALVLVAAVIVTTVLVVGGGGSSGPATIAVGTPASLAQMFPETVSGGCAPGDLTAYRISTSGAQPVEALQCAGPGDVAVSYARWNTATDATDRVVSYATSPSVDGQRQWTAANVTQGPYWQTVSAGSCTTIAAYSGLAVNVQLYAPADRCADVTAAFRTSGLPAGDQLRTVERSIPGAVREGCGAATPSPGTSGIVPLQVRSCTGPEGTTTTWSRWNGPGDVATEANARGSRSGETVSSWNAPNGPRQGPYLRAEDGGTCRALLGWDTAPYAAEVVGPDCDAVDRTVAGLGPPPGEGLPL